VTTTLLKYKEYKSYFIKYITEINIIEKLDG